MRPAGESTSATSPLAPSCGWSSTSPTSRTSPQGIPASSSRSAHAAAGASASAASSSGSSSARAATRASFVAKRSSLGELGPAEHVPAERLPVLRREDGHRDELPVAGAVGPVGAEERMVEAGALRQLAAVPPHVREVAEPVEHRVEERDLDVRALAGLRAADERGERGDGRVRAGAEVAGGEADAGRLLRRPGDRHESGLALHDEVVGVSLRVRAFRAVAADLDVDDVGAQAADGRLVEPDAGRPPGREVLEEDVGAADEGFQVGAALRVADVELDALLAAVDPDEAAREAGGDRVPPARDVAAARLLDLHDVGAEVGEEPRAERPREPDLARDDANAPEQHARSVVRSPPVETSAQRWRLPRGTRHGIGGTLEAGGGRSPFPTQGGARASN